MNSKKTNKIDVSIITPSYNTRDVTINTFESVIKYTKGVNYEIIVVDNGSTDGSVEALEKLSKKYSQVKFINAKKNLGFGKANNMGVEKSKGEYLLFLNSDTLFFDNALKEALATLKKHPEVGTYSCRLLNSDKTIQASGGHFPTVWNILAWQLFIDDLPLIGQMIPSFHPQLFTHDKPAKRDWVTGAFLMMPRKAFEEAGGFDDNIFMYTEETELAYRVKALGYKTLLTPKPAIIHLGKASSNSHFALTNEAFNMTYFFKKHKPAWQVPVVRFAFILGSLLRYLIFGIIKGDASARKTYGEIFKHYI